MIEYYLRTALYLVVYLFILLLHSLCYFDLLFYRIYRNSRMMNYLGCFISTA